MASQPRFQGNIASQPELGFPGLCLQDAPSGVRFADFVSVFPAGSSLPACPSSRAEEIETHFSLIIIFVARHQRRLYLRQEAHACSRSRDGRGVPG